MRLRKNEMENKHFYELTLSLLIIFCLWVVNYSLWASILNL